MARGWESKSVESQIESLESRRSRRIPEPDPRIVARQRELSSLELSRERVLRDIENTQHQGYRESLESALHFLDKKIADLNAHS